MALWTPAQIATVLWLDASDVATITKDVSNNVSSWNDKSGSDNHATQSTGLRQPLSNVDALNSLNVLSFDEDSFEVTLTGVRSIICCIPILNLSEFSNPICSDSVSFDYTFIKTDSEDYDISIDGGGTNEGNASVNGNNLVSGKNIELGLDIASKKTSNIWYMDYNNSINISTIFQQATNYFNGQVAEIIMLTSVPSELDRQKIEGYLAHKWGLTANLPAEHPYKSLAPTIPASGIDLDLNSLDIQKTLQDLDFKLSIELDFNTINIDKNIQDITLEILDRIINLDLSNLNIMRNLNSLSANIVVTTSTIVTPSIYSLYRKRMNSSKTDSQVADCEISNDIKLNFKQQPNYRSVYRNSDLVNSYDILFANGNVKDKSVGYKQLISYPYDTYVFNKGDYIHMTYGGISTTWLLISLETAELYNVKGRIEQCNNDLKWLDSNGNIQSYKCVIQDEIKEDRIRNNKTITMPDGYITVYVQDNADTRQLKINKRFIFEGTAYQIRSIINYANTGYIRYIMNKDTENIETDDLVNNIADVNELIYSISIVQDDFEQQIGYTTTLNYNLTLNGDVSTKDIEWISSDESIATVSSLGVINLLSLGEVTFTARMIDNTDVNDSISITVVNTLANTDDNVISPDITNIFQNETQTYTVYNYTDNVQTADTFTIVGSGASTTKYILTIIDGNSFSVKSLGYSSDKLLITCTNNIDTSVLFKAITLKGLW